MRLGAGIAAAALSCVAFAAMPVRSAAQPLADSTARDSRPAVAGGYDDKPYLAGIFGRIAVGGYAEFHARWERADGATDEAGFEIKRWNLLVHTPVSRVLDVWAEVEFEDGGQEIVLELAQMDFQMHPAFGLRCGMLLLPIGRFNLSHDGPRNEFTDRPRLATDLLGSALSMPGLGVFGQLPAGAHRATYEIYAVNGFHAGILDDSPDGTRLPAGRFNPEDANASPSITGRVAWDGGPAGELGLSGFRGLYNTAVLEGLEVDERRFVRIGALDARARALGVAWNGEGTLVSVDIPPGLVSIHASRQSGFFLEAARAFGAGWIRTLPGSAFGAAARIEGVDFDSQIPGDSIQQLTLGARFRPTPESVFKLDYQRGRARDRFNNASETAAFLFSLATYF